MSFSCDATAGDNSGNFPPLDSAAPSVSAGAPSPCVVALDIGGTKIAGCLIDRDGDIISTVASRQVRTPQTGGAEVAAVAALLARELRDDASGSYCPVAVGIGSAGVVGADGRTIVSATEAIPGWSGTSLAPIIEAATGLPTTVENDVHAHARGELAGGAGRGVDSALMVAVGTGIGGALISAGQVLRGARGLSGHVGHVSVSAAAGRQCSCGKLGHVEAIGSGPGMTRWYNDQRREQGGLSKGAASLAVDARDLEARAQAGDRLAQQILAAAAGATGEVIAGLVNSFDPQMVILGGGLAAAGELYWQPLLQAYEDALMPALSEVPLRPAQLGSAAALVGAGALAWRHYSQHTAGRNND